MSKKIKLMELMRKTGLGLESLKQILVKNGFADENASPNTTLDLKKSIAVVDVLCKNYGTSINKEATVQYKKDLEGIQEQQNQKPEVAKQETPAKEEPVTKEKPQAVKELGKIDLDNLNAKPEVKVEEVKKAEVKVEPKAEEKKEEVKSEVKKEVKEPKKDVPQPKKEEAKVEAKKVAKKEEPKAKKVEVKAETKKPEAKKEAKLEAKKEEPKEDAKAKKEEAVESNHIETVTPDAGIKFKVVEGAKIDLSQFDKPKTASKDKKKRVRKKKSNNPIDVDKEGKKIAEKTPNKSNNRSKTVGNNAGNNANAGANNRKNQQAKKKKKPVVKQEISDEDVQRQVKENLARLTNKGSKSAQQYKREKRQARQREEQRDRDQAVEDAKVLQLTEFVTVSDIASLMDVPVTKVIATCMSLGLMVSINMRLDAETIDIVADEFGFTTNYVSADVSEAVDTEEEDPEEDLLPRSPIVTVMGHVDHGKTSLLDRLRNSNVIEGEAGGITQHIGAYSVKVGDSKSITFLDTPGHEAFTAMRARGAKVTDIAIIIVAADDDVMPQTKEAINHASAAGVPMVFAINKIDKPGANPDRIREQLAAMNYLVEEWGGKYQCQEISAKEGTNVDELLEKVLLEAELLELKANPKRKAVGSIIESSLDKGRGYLATVLVQNGTLRTGDIVLSGSHFGKVKAMFNERNQRVNEVGPSLPVLILGLDGAPTAGEVFNIIDTEQEARTIANKREQLKREMDTRTKKGLTLEELARRRAMGNFQELNLIIKGDVDGSIEALADSLIRLSTEEIQVNVIHKGVGAISESDIVLAAASSAIVIGFQVRPNQSARRLADNEGVEIRTYSIIYDTIEDIKSAMEGMLSPEIKENIVANLEVQQTFKIGKIGTIAGCVVIEGKIKRTNKIRLIRDGIVKYAGDLGSLKRFKDDVKEVVLGQDCGLNIEGYNDIAVGDIIEAYEEIEVKKTL